MQQFSHMHQQQLAATPVSQLGMDGQQTRAARAPHAQECAQRIEGSDHEDAHCTGWAFDYWKCIDKCVSVTKKGRSAWAGVAAGSRI